ISKRVTTPGHEGEGNRREGSDRVEGERERESEREREREKGGRSRVARRLPAEWGSVRSCAPLAGRWFPRVFAQHLACIFRARTCSFCLVQRIARLQFSPSRRWRSHQIPAGVLR